MTAKTKPAKDHYKPRATKKAQLIQMLSTKAGADVEAISGKLRWQSHTTRAAITGLRKVGYDVSAAKEAGKPTRYRITAEPQVVASTGTTVDAGAAADPEPADAG